MRPTARLSTVSCHPDEWRASNRGLVDLVDLVASLPFGDPVDAVAALGAPFAVRAHSVRLDWSPEPEPALIAWISRNPCPGDR